MAGRAAVFQALESNRLLLASLKWSSGFLLGVQGDTGLAVTSQVVAPRTDQGIQRPSSCKSHPGPCHKQTQGPAWPPALCSAAWCREAQTTSKGNSRSVSAPETQRERTCYRARQGEEVLCVEDSPPCRNGHSERKPHTHTHTPQAEPTTFRSSARGTRSFCQRA